MTVTPLGRDQDCSLKNREPDVPPSWFLDPGGWSKTAAVSLYFIFPGICTLSLLFSPFFNWTIRYFDVTFLEFVVYSGDHPSVRCGIGEDRLPFCGLVFCLSDSLSLIISWHLFLLGEFASSRSRALSFDLVYLSIGWNPPSSAFCRAGFLYLDGYFLIYVGKIFFNDFVKYVFCAFELVFFSFFYSYYSKVRPFHGVPDFLDILCYDLFGFGVFLDC
ncbi:hypothetical protein STEG23_002459 [Scotinomys teguina]